MNTILLSLLLLLQGIPVQPQQGGIITGTLKDGTGKPIPGIRMAAIARVDPSIAPASTGAAMSSIAQTDEQGHYRLENVPPGHYYVAAGRLDRQTYYPGTQNLDAAKEVLVTPGLTVDGINFPLNDTSAGRADIGSGILGTPISVASVPLQVTTENGRKLPVSSNGGQTTVRLNLVSGGNPSAPYSAAPLYEASIAAYGPQPSEIRVSIENLPDTYFIKSVKYGSADITNSTFKLTPANFSPVTSPMIFLGAVNGPVVSGPLIQLLQRSTVGNVAVTIFGNATVSLVPGAQPAPSTPPVTPPATLAIVLGEAAPPKAPGVMVSGKLGPNSTLDDLSRIPYISGTPGTMFEDGTLEFRNVLPGKYLIFMLTNAASSKPWAASVVVGEGNLDGITLEQIPFLPPNVRPAKPEPAGALPSGQVRLPRIHGTLTNEDTKQPIPEGTVVLWNGASTQPYAIDANGKFEIPMLAKGRYRLDINIFGHSNIRETIDIADKDITLDLTSRKLY